MLEHNPPYALIFDLDGTLIDSEENYFESDRLLFGQFGIQFTEEMKREYIGTGNFEMMKRIKARYGFSQSAEELLALKNDLYLTVARGATAVYPEMRRLVEIMAGRHVPMAIASGTSPHIIDVLLDECGLAQFFPVVVSAEDVAQGKPAPDVFVEAARRLNVPCSACVVFEDARYGVMAAHAAGMRCVAIPYIVEDPLPPAFDTADLLFSGGMQSFRAERVIEWLDCRT